MLVNKVITLLLLSCGLANSSFALTTNIGDCDGRVCSASSGVGDYDADVFVSQKTQARDDMLSQDAQIAIYQAELDTNCSEYLASRISFLNAQIADANIQKSNDEAIILKAKNVLSSMKEHGATITETDIQ